MIPEITHIGIKQQRSEGFRYKRLRNSGIFRDNETHQKLIDCQGPFEEWTNAPARDWIMARVKEYREGRKVHIVCDCCESRDAEFLEDLKGAKLWQTIGLVNPNCYGPEIVELILSLAKEESE